MTQEAASDLSSLTDDELVSLLREATHAGDRERLIPIIRERTERGRRRAVDEWRSSLIRTGTHQRRPLPRSHLND